jgi:hypothetical protein
VENKQFIQIFSFDLILYFCFGQSLQQQQTESQGTLQAIWLERSTKFLGKKSVNFYSTFSVRRNLFRQKNLLRKNFA